MFLKSYALRVSGRLQGWMGERTVWTGPDRKRIILVLPDDPPQIQKKASPPLQIC